MATLLVIYSILLLFPLVYSWVKKPSNTILYLSAVYGHFVILNVLLLLIVNPLFLFANLLLPQVNEHFKSNTVTALSSAIEIFNQYAFYAVALIIPWLSIITMKRYSYVFAPQTKTG